MNELEFEIDRDAAGEYFRAVQSLYCVIALGWLFGLGFFVGLIHYFQLGLWLGQARSINLRYWIEDGKLQINDGTLSVIHQLIPLEQITDVVIVQGMLMRCFGVWVLRVRSTGTPRKATLYGVREPEKVRETILAQRQST